MRKLRISGVSKEGAPKQTSRKGLAGFTLVELLVVIAIIALLMAILMPALQRVKKHAEEVMCRQNLRQVGIILFMFLQDNDFVMPKVRRSAGNDRCNEYLWKDPATGVFLTADDKDTYWALTMIDYIKDTNIFGCPAFKNSAEMRAMAKLYGYNVKAFYDSAFCFNAYLTEANTNTIRDQGVVITIHDHIEPRIEQGTSKSSGDMLCQPEPGLDNLSHYRTGSRKQYYRAIFRHNVRYSDDHRTGGRLNVLYLDNHVDRIEETTGSDISPFWYDPLKEHFTSP